MRTPRVRAGLLVYGISSVAQGIFVVLFIVFVARVLHGDAAEIGLLRGVQAIGAITAGVALALSPRISAGRLTAAAAIAFGVLDLTIWNAPLLSTGEYRVRRTVHRRRRPGHGDRHRAHHGAATGDSRGTTRSGIRGGGRGGEHRRGDRDGRGGPARRYGRRGHDPQRPGGALPDRGRRGGEGTRAGGSRVGERARDRGAGRRAQSGKIPSPTPRRELAQRRPGTDPHARRLRRQDVLHESGNLRDALRRRARLRPGDASASWRCSRA